MLTFGHKYEREDGLKYIMDRSLYLTAKVELEYWSLTNTFCNAKQYSRIMKIIYVKIKQKSSFVRNICVKSFDLKR